MTDIRIRAMLLAAALAVSGCGTDGKFRLDAGDLRPAQPSTTPAVATSIIAAMKGGLIGAAAERLDETERRLALEAEYRALEFTPAGQAVKWQGGSGRNGEVVAAQPYRVGSQDCRQYSHAFLLDGLRQTVRGTACRNADGSWTPLT